MVFPTPVGHSFLDSSLGLLGRLEEIHHDCLRIDVPLLAVLSHNATLCVEDVRSSSSRSQKGLPGQIEYATEEPCHSDRALRGGGREKERRRANWVSRDESIYVRFGVYIYIF